MPPTFRATTTSGKDYAVCTEQAEDAEKLTNMRGLPSREPVAHTARRRLRPNERLEKNLPLWCRRSPRRLRRPPRGLRRQYDELNAGLAGAHLAAKKAEARKRYVVRDD